MRDTNSLPNIENLLRKLPFIEQFKENSKYTCWICFFKKVLFLEYLIIKLNGTHT